MAFMRGHQIIRYSYLSAVLAVLVSISNYSASYLFSLLNPLASYAGQAIILATTIGLVLILKRVMKNEINYSSFMLVAYVYVISIGSWHLFLTNHPLSPDVNYETLIVKEITRSGYIGDPQRYYYAARLYAEFPATELLASILSVTMNYSPYPVMKYLWIYIKSVLIFFLFLFFRKMDAMILDKEIKDEEIILFSTIPPLIVLSSSSSIYFFSFTVHNLTSLALMMIIMYFYTKAELTKSKLGSLAVIATLIISHNATLVVFIIWIILLLILKIADHAYNRVFIELCSLAMSIAYFLYISHLNFNNIIKTLEYFLIQEHIQLHTQLALAASISPIKPSYYRISGIIHVLILAMGALYGILLSLKRRMFLRAFRPWLLLFLFSVTYFIILTLVPLLAGRGLDVLVRSRLPLALIATVPLADILTRLLRKGNKWRGAALVVVFLYLIGGFYDLVPPAVYDKCVQYSMDDPRYSIMLEQQFDVLRYLLHRNEGRSTYSIALGYNYVGGFGIPYLPLSLLSIENEKSEYVAILRWDLQSVPDYGGVSIDVNSVLRMKHTIFNSGNLYVVIN